MKRERERLLKYEKATILVRFVQNKCDNEVNDQAASLDDDENDKSFHEVNILETINRIFLTFLFFSQAKKFKKINSDDFSVATNVMGTPRRSTRKRKYRDVKEFVVSSDLTLLQLKIKVLIF